MYKSLPGLVFLFLLLRQTNFISIDLGMQWLPGCVISSSLGKAAPSWWFKAGLPSCQTAFLASLLYSAMSLFISLMCSGYKTRYSPHTPYCQPFMKWPDRGHCLGPHPFAMSDLLRLNLGFFSSQLTPLTSPRKSNTLPFFQPYLWWMWLNWKPSHKFADDPNR